MDMQRLVFASTHIWDCSMLALLCRTVADPAVLLGANSALAGPC